MNDKKLAQCFLCGGSIIEIFLTAYDRQIARPEDYVYSKCNSCGLIFLNPLPEPEQIPGFYPFSYSPHQDKIRTGKPALFKRLLINLFYDAGKSANRTLMRKLLAPLSVFPVRNLFKPYGANRLLEVGCGSGASLERHQSLGWTVKGIEINGMACEICRTKGIDVHCGTLLDVRLAGEKFDIIFFNHVLEHLLDPVSVFQKAAECLSPSGRIIILTPNSDALSFSKYMSTWYQLDAPRHIFLYGPESISRLCARTGLAVMNLKTLPSPKIWCQSRHINKTQGTSLPGNIEERKAVIELSGKKKSSFEFFRKSITPLCLLSAKLGRGENLRAELIRSF